MVGRMSYQSAKDNFRLSYIIPTKSMPRSGQLHTFPTNYFTDDNLLAYICDGAEILISTCEAHYVQVLMVLLTTAAYLPAKRVPSPALRVAVVLLKRVA